MSGYSIDTRIYDTIMRDKFPKMYGMLNIDTISYTRNLRKLARLVMYERREAVDLTKEEVLTYLLEHPEVYEYIQL